MAFPRRRNYRGLSGQERALYAAKIQVAAEEIYQRCRMCYPPQDLARLHRYLEGVDGSPVKHLVSQIEAGLFDTTDWAQRLAFLPGGEALRFWRLQERFLDRRWQEMIQSEPDPGGFKNDAANWLDLYIKRHASLSPYLEAPEGPMFLVTAYGHPDRPVPTHTFEMPPVLAFGEVPPAGPMTFLEAVEDWERPVGLSVYGNIVVGLLEEDGKALFNLFHGNGLKVWRLQATPAVPPPPVQVQASTPAPPQPVHPLAEPIGGSSGSDFRTIRPARR